MKHAALFVVFVISTILTFGQNSADEYGLFSGMADSLFRAKDYKAAATTYSKAFKSLGWKGSQVHRYNAACSWAMAGGADSAFFNLYNIATKQSYMDYEHITTDPHLYTLHKDKRWNPLIDIVRQNKDKAAAAEAKLNKPLMARLDSIFKADQVVRIQIDTIEKAYGWESPQMKAHLRTIKKIDSINLIKVKDILDTHGWLGSDVIGSNGNLTLFLVIQHSDLSTRQKYLPMMREAVKNGRAMPHNLALLEDRVSLEREKKQRYGSQIGRDKETGNYYILPLEDPDNVDKRRAEMGLEPMAEYVKRWQIKWDAEQYKKDLPAIEAKEKGRSK